MARLSLLGPLDAPLPQALELLPHSISRYDDLQECMSHLEGVDVVLVDCHDEPTRARHPLSHQPRLGNGRLPV